MNNHFNVDEKYINNLLEQLEQDRNKFFNEIKTATSYDKTKEQKLKQLDTLQRNLIFYKQILIKEKESK